MYLQDLIFTLQKFWADRGCVIEQPVDVEVGAGTFHPATFLRVLGPEPWNAAFVQFCRRPSDGRYGENPNRAGAYYQFQVGLKPSPLHVQDLYLDSLRAIGLDPAVHDIRFVEDDWESPTLGAWGLGWEVWCDGMEVTQFTYFQQAGGIDLLPVTAELTYGVERLAMYLQGVPTMYDLKWDKHVTYGQLRKPWEVEYSTYHFEQLDPAIAFRAFDTHEGECKRLLEASLVLPAYEHCMKSSHAFNTLDARGAISVTERQRFIGRVRGMARACAHAYVESRARLGFPLLPPAIGAEAVAAYRGVGDAGVNAGALAAGRATTPHAHELPHVTEQERSNPVRAEHGTESPHREGMPRSGAGDHDVLFEIGCEEIPAKMLARALDELPAQVAQQLAAARIPHGDIRAIGTPRRLAVIVKKVAERQQDVREEIVGPPVSAAFAPDGSLTKAGQGFAAKNGVDASAVAKKEVAGKKGLYAVATRELVGQDVRGLLPGVLTALATSLKWPKSMRWGWTDSAFVRPVQWLVALFGGEVIPLTWAGHTAGRASRGHRFLANRAIEIASADRYEHALREAHVVVDPIARRTAIEGELRRLEKETGSRVRPDAALLDEVANLGEYPVGVCGQFEPAFLEVPEEIIVTAMRTHQRYFAMEDAHGKLAPRFATVAATIVKDPKVVATGNETVLASRLADAKFFFGEDLKKHGFDAWNQRLDGVVFQAKLPEAARTVGAKVRRIAALVAHTTTDADARRAAQLCKADLASHVVGEFPELQGVMGRRYADRFGESPAVAAAIEQHWWPKGQGAALPTKAGELVAIADRVDTLVGCFATGLVPTGNADPLGLRRAAIGVLQILLAHEEQQRTLSYWIDTAADGYAGAPALAAKTRGELVEFFAQRLKNLLVDEHDIDVQVAELAIAVGIDQPFDVVRRARALGKVPAGTRAVFKRIGNILDDARAKGFGTQPAPAADKFVAEVERSLHAAHAAHAAAIATNIAGGRYGEAFDALATMEQVLAAFFDKGGVMVMDPDAALRENRLALLRTIYEPFAKIGDFRKLGASS